MALRHVVLVSNQPVPSLTPLLDPGLGVTAATLVHAPDRRDHARWLAAALADYGVAAELWPLRDGYDLPGVRAELGALAQRYPQGVAVNITGGTKLMTIAAWECFQRPGDRIYYIDIRDDSLRWLYPQAGAQPVSDRITLEGYLLAHGWRVSEQYPLRRDTPDAAVLAQARQRAHQLARSLKPHRSDGGHWLEDWVFAQVQALQQGDTKIQDCARQFRLQPCEEGSSSGIYNEIDIAVLRDNTLYVIECKTGQAGRGGEAAKAIYKLAQLVERLGGLRGRGVLVTTEVLSRPLRARAQQSRIATIERFALGQLPAALRACWR